MKKSALLSLLLFCVLQANSRPLLAHTLPEDKKAHALVPEGTVEEGDYSFFTRRTGFEFDGYGSIVFANYSDGFGFGLRGIQWLEPHFGIGASLGGYGFGYGGAYLLMFSMKYAFDGPVVRPYFLGGLGIASTAYPALEAGFGVEWMVEPSVSFFTEVKPTLNVGYSGAGAFLPISAGVAFGSPRDSFRYKEAGEGEPVEAKEPRRRFGVDLLGGAALSSNFGSGPGGEIRGTLWPIRPFGIGLSASGYSLQRPFTYFDSSIPGTVYGIENIFLFDLSILFRIDLIDSEVVRPYLVGGGGVTRIFSALAPDETLHVVPRGGVGVEIPLGKAISLMAEAKVAHLQAMRLHYFPLEFGIAF